MKLRRHNWLGETARQNLGRRVKALEAHVNDLEQRLGEQQNSINLLHPMPPRPPETDEMLYNSCSWGHATHDMCDDDTCGCVNAALHDYRGILP